MFVVQSVGSGCYKTAISIRGSYYEFQESANYDFPVIIEIRDNGNGKRLQLLPNNLFRGEDESYDFPDELVEEYGHWLSIEGTDDAKIHFRPIKYHEPQFVSTANGTYVLKLNEKIVYNKVNQTLVDMKSTTFQEFATVFKRITPTGNIHVFVSKCDNKTYSNPVVQLPKLRNIRFELEDGDHLSSIEYKGMKVSENQNFGSLIGLKNGLLLKGSEHEDGIFLCPHGQVNTNKSGEIEINTVNLRSPAFFKYTLRTDIQDIRAGKERIAWEYLSLLHASTSGLLPDPFTKCLGMAKGKS